MSTDPSPVRSYKYVFPPSFFMEYTNHLIHETSPYLQQHAHNPVNWYPWSEEAFLKAKQENKPVFLSIGYSSCHWCHVMRHESFEDAEVAQLLNETFVCIKVDREERPDIDATFMAAVQVMHRHAGWPATLVLTPEKKPFFAATYIPKTSKYGIKGLLDLIPEIKQLWETRRDDVERFASDVNQRVQLIFSSTSTSEDLSMAILDDTYETLQYHYDTAYGGFTTAPKFPSAHQLLFLLRYFWWKHDQQDDQALDMVNTTLQHIRLGGIFDHVGGGVHRYSTDEKWLLPHFEKMLYDQAMLILALTEAYQITQSPEYERTVRKLIRYLTTNLKQEKGAYYSSQDADTDGEEGKYYTWEYKELQSLLTPDDLNFMVTVYNIEPDGNYYDESTHEKTNRNILFMTTNETRLAKQMNLELHEFLQIQERIMHQLLQARNKRTRPATDKKIMADWNGLLLAALSKAHQVFQEPLYLELATQLATFITNRFIKENYVYHLYDEYSQLPKIFGFLDDYAFTIYGLLTYYETIFDPKYLVISYRLAMTMIQLFWDHEHHGFFFTSQNHEPLLARKKDAYDGSYPSGNSIASYVLSWLSDLLGDHALLEHAENTIKAFGELIEHHPSAFTFMLQTYLSLQGAKSEVIIIGNQTEKIHEFIHAIRTTYTPTTSILAINTAKPSETALIHEIAPFTKTLTMLNNKTTAYVCKNFTCSSPTTNVNQVLKQIQSIHEK